MLTAHRKQQILSLLIRNGQVIAKEVSQSMGVSEDTIRRDLREMAQDFGTTAKRVHGQRLCGVAGCRDLRSAANAVLCPIMSVNRP